MKDLKQGVSQSDLCVSVEPLAGVEGTEGQGEGSRGSGDSSHRPRPSGRPADPDVFLRTACVLGCSPLRLTGAPRCASVPQCLGFPARLSFASQTESRTHMHELP